MKFDSRRSGATGQGGSCFLQRRRYKTSMATPLLEMQAARKTTAIFYCLATADVELAAAGEEAAPCLTGSTTNWPEALVPGISVSFEMLPDLASATVMLYTSSV